MSDSENDTASSSDLPISTLVGGNRCMSKLDLDKEVSGEQLNTSMAGNVSNDNNSEVVVELVNDTNSNVMTMLQNMMGMLTNMDKRQQEFEKKTDDKLNTLSTQVNLLQASMSEMEHKFEEVNSTVSKLTDRVSVVETNLQDVINDHTQFDSKIVEYNSRCGVLENRVDVLDKEVNEMGNNNEILKGNVKDFNTEVNHNVKRLGKLIENVDFKIEQCKESCNNRSVSFKTDMLLEWNRFQRESKQELNDFINGRIEVPVQAGSNETSDKINERVDLLSREKTDFVLRKDEVRGNEIYAQNTETAKKLVNSSISSISSVSNVELYLVDFYGNNDKTHPMHFLKFAKKFNELCTEMWEAKLLTIVKHLHGEANLWARTMMISWVDFKAFESSFRKKFWSKQIQRNFENDLASNGHFHQGKTDLVTYVMSYYDKSTYLDNQMDIIEFLTHISKHLPSHMAAAVATAKGINNQEDLELMLTQLMNLNFHQFSTNKNFERSRSFDRPTRYETRYTRVSRDTRGKENRRSPSGDNKDRFFVRDAQTINQSGWARGDKDGETRQTDARPKEYNSWRRDNRESNDA